MIGYEPQNWAAVVFRVRGTVIPRVFGRTLLVTLVAIGLVVLRDVGGFDASIPAAAHAMVGVALGLLLVFRTNASYDRYWEGRKLLGAIVNGTRNVARKAGAYLDDDARRDVRRLLTVWLGCVQRALRLQSVGKAELELLTPGEREGLEGASSPVVSVATLLSAVLDREVEAGRLAEERLRVIDRTIDDLIDTFGGAERIVKTPVPLAYAHHIKTFLTLFCVTAPLALVGGMGLLTPVAATIVAFGLYGIDEIGVEIEDPFGDDLNDLPMDEIFTALRDLLDEGSTAAGGVEENLANAG